MISSGSSSFVAISVTGEPSRLLGLSINGALESVSCLFRHMYILDLTSEAVNSAFFLHQKRQE